MRQQVGRDADVVIDDLGFGKTILRVKNLVEVGNGNVTPVDLEVICATFLRPKCRTLAFYCLFRKPR